MRHRRPRSPGASLARWTRWLGFDRNPLRRRTDRIEAVLRLVTMILLLAPAGAHAGSTVKVWVDASGAVTGPPPDPRVIAGDVTMSVIVTGLIASMLVLGSNALARRALDRQRMRAWDAEWRAAGPQWTGHPG